MKTVSYLSLGSNLGDRTAALRTALILLGETPGTTILDYSSVYDTEPVADEKQPEYANMVAKIETDLSPQELLTHIHMIEADLGRVRVRPNSPRTIDIDIILYGDEVINEENLIVPHPRCMGRDFVVTPLLEIWPDAVLPDGKRVDRDAILQGACLDVIGKMTLPDFE